MSKIAILFAGQGAQSVGMGKDLYEHSNEAKQLFDLGEKFRPGTIHMCFEGEGPELTQTENAQPCLFLTDLAFAQELRNAGVSFSAAAGFSLGEIPALAFTNVMTNEDAFRLVMLRGKEMKRCAEEHPGSMAAVMKLAPEQVEEICSEFQEVWPVNYNCPGQIACAGSVAELDDFVERVKAAGGRAVKLNVSGAFHTPYLKSASEKLAEALAEIEVKAPEIPLYSDMTGTPYSASEESIRENISEQASNSVRFEKLIRAMAESGIDTFVEVGPGKTLTGLVKKTLPEAVTYTVNDWESCQEAIAALK